MDTTTLENQLVALRAGDGALEQRLTELDAKLGAWLAAVEAGQAALRELARKVVPSAVPCETQTGAVPPTSPGGAPRLVAGPAAVTALRQEPDPGAADGCNAQQPQERADSEETLLETLDPETAKVIRVKRRLTGGRRSVRELLEEYRAAPAQAPDKPPARRGWWRRRNG